MRSRRGSRSRRLMLALRKSRRRFRLWVVLVARRRGNAVLKASLVLCDLLPPRGVFLVPILGFVMLGEFLFGAMGRLRAGRRLGCWFEDAGLKPAATSAVGRGRRFCFD